MSGRVCVRSPCSKGWPLTAVAFILRASLADVSQCEPLLVSWSLSAWSLSPWPLSRRLARSASLNVELQQNGWGEARGRDSDRERETNTKLNPSPEWVFLFDSHSQLTRCIQEAFEPLTSGQMVACCLRNWTLRGNFLSISEKTNKQTEKKPYFYILLNI